MKPSIYLSIAALFIRLDLAKEVKQGQKRARHLAEIPWHNAHLLRDLGLAVDLMPTSLSFAAFEHIANQRVRHFRRVIASRMRT